MYATGNARVRGGDIGALGAAWAVGAPRGAECVAESVGCGGIAVVRAGSPGAVLLAIAVDIASKSVNTCLAHARGPHRESPFIEPVEMP